MLPNSLNSLVTYREEKKYFIVREAIGMWDEGYYAPDNSSRKVFFETPVWVYFYGDQKTIAENVKQPYGENRRGASRYDNISDALGYKKLVENKEASRYVLSKTQPYIVEETVTVINSVIG